MGAMDANSEIQMYTDLDSTRVSSDWNYAGNFYEQGGKPCYYKAIYKTSRTAILKSLREQSKNSLPSNQLADGKGKQRPKAKTTLENLLFPKKSKRIAISGDFTRSPGKKSGHIGQSCLDLRLFTALLLGFLPS